MNVAIGPTRYDPGDIAVAVHFWERDTSDPSRRTFYRGENYGIVNSVEIRLASTKSAVVPIVKLDMPLVEPPSCRRSSRRTTIAASRAQAQRTTKQKKRTLPARLANTIIKNCW